MRPTTLGRYARIRPTTAAAFAAGAAFGYAAAVKLGHSPRRYWVTMFDTSGEPHRFDSFPLAHRDEEDRYD